MESEILEAEIGVIGGSGVYSLEALENVEKTKIKTPYEKSPEIITGKLGEKKVAFLPRHGKGHGTPPHKINYRANIYSLKKLGVKRILATTAVGSLNADVGPGEFVILDQFLDFTKNRNYTFYGEENEKVVHIDMTDPYCPELRKVLQKQGKKLGKEIHSSGTYVCTEGPRFETGAEIQMYNQLGGDVVGMTNVPESVLAREKEICYSTVSVVTNYAAGISEDKLTHEEVAQIMDKNIEKVKELFFHAIQEIPEERECSCKNALEGAKVEN